MTKETEPEESMTPRALPAIPSSAAAQARRAEIESVVAFVSRDALSYEEAAWSLAEAVERRDPYTGGHIRRVLAYSLAIVRYLDFPSDLTKTLELSAILHDIGKIAIDERILCKKGPLSPEERALMRHHPVFGSEILLRTGWLRETVPGMLHHHERLDGSGYPMGLRGREIPWIARIIAVADSYDAMTSSRPYRRAWTPGKAMSQLMGYAGTQFDREIVHAFFTAYRQGEVKRAFLSAREGHA